VPVNYYFYLWQRGLKFRSHELVGEYIKSKIPGWETSHPGYNWK
jgi:hypothetical protein